MNSIQPRTFLIIVQALEREHRLLSENTLKRLSLARREVLAHQKDKEKADQELTQMQREQDDQLLQSTTHATKLQFLFSLALNAFELNLQTQD